MSTVQPRRGRSSRTNPVCRSPWMNASGGESSSRTTVNRSGHGRPLHVALSRVITAPEDHYSLPSSLSSTAICSREELLSPICEELHVLHQQPPATTP